MGLDDGGGGGVVQAEHRLHHHRPGHRMAGVQQQQLHDLELAGRQLHPLALQADGARQAVQLQTTRLQQRRGAGQGRPPSDRLDPGVQLRQFEGLDQIVVRACPQALHPVGDPAHRGQEDDRRADPCGAQGADQGQAVEARQHAVDDQALEPHVRAAHQAGATVGGDLDLMTAGAEALGDMGRRRCVIFDKQ